MRFSNLHFGANVALWRGPLSGLRGFRGVLIRAEPDNARADATYKKCEMS